MHPASPFIALGESFGVVFELKEVAFGVFNYFPLMLSGHLDVLYITFALSSVARYLHVSFWIFFSMVFHARTSIQEFAHVVLTIL